MRIFSKYEGGLWGVVNWRHYSRARELVGGEEVARLAQDFSGNYFDSHSLKSLQNLFVLPTFIECFVLTIMKKK